MVDEFVRLLKSYPVGENDRALVLGEPDDLLADIRAKLAELAANESVRGGSSADGNLPEPPVEDGRVVAGVTGLPDRISPDAEAAPQQIRY